MHPARPWPEVETGKDGLLWLLLDRAADHPGHVDWLRVRDWLIENFSARFDEGFEYPTFEWYARFDANTYAGPVVAKLWWHDFPDHLSIIADSGPGDEFILDVAKRLRECLPHLGDLKTMNRKEWKRWMSSLGSPEYR